jgi:GDP-L-fucose synthase
MKVLVTGSSGFLGQSLCPALDSNGHTVTRLTSKICDLRDPTALNAWNQDRFDLVYHLAAWTQAGDFCLRHQGEQWIINQQINTNVLAWWQKAQPQAKLVAIGSSCSYPSDRPLVEENYLEGLPIESLFSYAMTKRMLYAGLVALNRQFGLNYLCLVPSTLYGPGYHTDHRQMHFIFDLTRKILMGKLYDTPVVLWGDGCQRRELIHISDFVKISIALSEHCENSLINVGTGKEHTIQHYARKICDYVGYDFNRIRFDETRYVGAKSKCLNIDRLRKALPGLQFVPLSQGIASVIQWFLENKTGLLSQR